ncbi:MAG: YqhA family protein [Pseudomonadota bacterium]|nr:YqhA family protein [Pseudomonadota bacterium]
MPKTTFEKLMFSCRWLLTPFYVALVVALAALLVKVVMRAYGLAISFQTLSEEDVILGALGVVDLTLTACLVVLVVFSTYSNFVARIEPAEHTDWPNWMVGIDYGELKLKLIASIVAISSIKLLEAYMNLDHETDRVLMWQVGIFGAFVGAALFLGIAEAVGHAYGGKGE